MKWSAMKERIQKVVADPKSEYYNYEFNEALSLLIRERFTSRIAGSNIRDSVILKGGLLLTMLYSKSSRYTSDIDILLKQAHKLSDFQKSVDAIIKVDLDDGFSFSRNNGTIVSNDHRGYDGAEFTITCSFAERQSQKFMLDIGVGDEVSPVAAKLPTLKEFAKSSLELLVYPPETIAAEKMEAIISRGARTSRLKDFYDLYVLRGLVDKRKFRLAVRKTFAQRGTEFPSRLPDQPEEIEIMQPKWELFLKSKSYRILEPVPISFSAIIEELKTHYST